MQYFTLRESNSDELGAYILTVSDELGAHLDFFLSVRDVLRIRDEIKKAGF
jgi:hypothetical protein